MRYLVESRCHDGKWAELSVFTSLCFTVVQDILPKVPLSTLGQPCNGPALYSGTNKIARSRFMPCNSELALLWWIRTRTLPLPSWSILRTHQHQLIAAVRLRRDVRDVSEKWIHWKAERVTLPLVCKIYFRWRCVCPSGANVNRNVCNKDIIVSCQ